MVRWQSLWRRVTSTEGREGPHRGKRERRMHIRTAEGRNEESADHSANTAATTGDVQPSRPAAQHSLRRLTLNSGCSDSHLA